MKLRGAWGHEAQALAQLHAAAFDHAWSADEIAQLLDGRAEIYIRHQGELYRLRQTRQGKLILTK